MIFMTTFVQVALPVPLFRCFDYSLPDTISPSHLKPGMRVQVPFGHRQMVGILLSIKKTTDYPKCKPIKEILDDTPVLTDGLLTLCQFAADYYHHPIGQVLATALPVKLRKGSSATATQEKRYTVTKTAKIFSLQALKRAPKQATALTLIKNQINGLTESQLKQLNISKATLNTLVKKGWLQYETQPLLPEHDQTQPKGPTLNPAQQQATQTINKTDGFAVFLLNGVTGSGKTEVYMQTIAHRLKQKQQVLILIPEIGLTPQTIARFQSRFKTPIVALHSGLNDQERLNAWALAKSGFAKIVIGTRSAIFTPFAQLGLIVIDEEHDGSYKQQDNFRYHARDLSVIRAKQLNIPLVLGSATPSLESVYNVEQDKYIELLLPERAGGANKPKMSVIDCRNKPIENGLTQPLISAIKDRLQQNQQVLIFLNRRGFAPVLMCHGCGWVSHCHRCSANLTLHHKRKQLLCHHCLHTEAIPTQCPNCQYAELQPIGHGTERLEETLVKLFPSTSIIRIDRDTTKNKNALDQAFKKINNGNAQILIGTQMLAKGHHFPRVTLVALLDVDGGLFSADFRATERMGQLITQVAGRAGRAELPGEVLLQTHHPDHPLLQLLVKDDYAVFAKTLLQERKQAHLPPFSHFALFRAQANTIQKPMSFLNDVKKHLPNTMDCLGPIPANMPKKAGFYRAQLMVQANSRANLQKELHAIKNKLELIHSAKAVRWVIDVDPLEVL